MYYIFYLINQQLKNGYYMMEFKPKQTALHSVNCNRMVNRQLCNDRRLE